MVLNGDSIFYFIGIFFCLDCKNKKLFLIDKIKMLKCGTGAVDS